MVLFMILVLVLNLLKQLSQKTICVREFAFAKQWLYWNRGQDLWAKIGCMLKANRGEE